MSGVIQHAAKPGCLVIVGKSGSGKSTFALRYAVARRDLACVFIYDPKGDMAERLGLVAAESVDDLHASVEDGFCIYDSAAMFPGDRNAGFAWFCEWSYTLAGAMPGRKLLLVDEVWRYCSPYAIPGALSQWIQDGRKGGMETAFCTQTPNKLHESITNDATELVCFRVQGRNALLTVSELGVGPDEVKTLPLGAFVALNCETGAELRGRLW